MSEVEFKGHIETIGDAARFCREEDRPALARLLDGVEQYLSQLRQQLEAAEARADKAEVELAKIRDDYAHLELDKDGLTAVIRECVKQEPIAEVGRHGKSGDLFLIELKHRALCKGMKLYSSPVPAMPIHDDISRSTFALWWSMVEAENNLAEYPIKDDEIILHYMGCGASCQVTAGDIRNLLGRNVSEVKPS